MGAARDDGAAEVRFAGLTRPAISKSMSPTGQVSLDYYLTPAP
jgi:hypothetical protein